MPKAPKDMTDSPKRGNYKLRSRKKKKKELEQKCRESSDSDSDSSSDYQPGDDLGDPEMNNHELQKFIQKIFPSKSGKERLKQLEKIDKLIEKEDKEERKKSVKKRREREAKERMKKRRASDPTKTEKEEIEEDSEEEEEETDADVEYDCEGFPECEDEELDETMKEMLNNNMKFNIIFTVGEPGMGAMEFPEDYEEDEYYFDDDEDEDEEEEEEEEDDEEEDEDAKDKAIKERISKKKCDAVTEEEWMEMARIQEKEMKKDGTFYSTKYKKNDTILFKKKGWKEFKNGKITNVNRNKTRSKVTYDIKLDKKFKGKSIYKKIPSTRLKKPEKDGKNDDDIVLEELKELIKTKEGKGKEAMEKKFNQLDTDVIQHLN